MQLNFHKGVWGGVAITVGYPKCDHSYIGGSGGMPGKFIIEVHSDAFLTSPWSSLFYIILYILCLLTVITFLVVSLPYSRCPLRHKKAVVSNDVRVVL